MNCGLPNPSRPYARKPIRWASTSSNGRSAPLNLITLASAPSSCRHLRAHGPGRRRCTPDLQVPISMALVGIACAFAGTVLRGDGGGSAGRRQRVHVFVRHDGRAYCLDHRLGSGARVCRGRRDRGRGLVRPPRVAPQPARLQDSAASRRIPDANGAPACRCNRRWQGACTRGSNFTGAWLNLPAVYHCRADVHHLVIGIKESASVNNLIVILKVMNHSLIIAVGLGHINPQLQALHRRRTPASGARTAGRCVLRAPGFVFFAYIGFDAVSTAAQEARNPQKDMPIGILGSLAICTISLRRRVGDLVGMVPYKELNLPRRSRTRWKKVGAPHWFVISIDVGPCSGCVGDSRDAPRPVTRVLLDDRVDGLLGKWAGAVHPRYRTPYLSTIFTGIAVSFARAAALQLLGSS